MKRLRSKLAGFGFLVLAGSAVAAEPRLLPTNPPAQALSRPSSRRVTNRSYCLRASDSPPRVSPPPHPIRSGCPRSPRVLQPLRGRSIDPPRTMSRSDR